MHSLYGTAAPQAGVTTRSGDERPWSLTRRTLVYLSLLGLAFLLFTITMGGFDPDENAYVLGAYLTQKHHIYKENKVSYLITTQKKDLRLLAWLEMPIGKLI